MSRRSDGIPLLMLHIPSLLQRSWYPDRVPRRVSHCCQTACNAWHSFPFLTDDLIEQGSCDVMLPVITMYFVLVTQQCSLPHPRFAAQSSPAHDRSDCAHGPVALYSGETSSQQVL